MPTHVLERVVTDDGEALHRQTSDRRQILLGVGHCIDPLFDLSCSTDGLTNGREEVVITVFSTEKHVLAPNFSQANHQEQHKQEAQEGDAGHDGGRKSQFFQSEFRHGGSSYTGGMRAEEVNDLLIAVKEGRLAPDDAVGLLREPVHDLGFAQIDIHRELRQGLPETIYAEHKTTEQTVAIAERMLAGTTGPVIATRVPKDAIGALRARFPELTHNEVARVAVLRSEIGESPRGLVAVITAGTSDQPVAEEAAVVAEACAIKVERVADAGVAGLHRILAARAPLAEADAVIVVAGMEGALPSIVGGLTGAPIIAVPTSVGYGASFDGLSALLGMLNSCAAGVVVCNIDNGFGAAMCALRIVNGKSR